MTPVRKITTEVVTTNDKARSEGFSPHVLEVTTKVVITNVEVGGAGCV